MRRIVLLTAVLALLLACPAWAEEYAYRSERGLDCRDRVAEIGGEMPEELRDALEQAGFGEDEVLSGVLCNTTTKYLALSPSENEWAVMALGRGEGTLLLYARRSWQQERWTPWQLTPMSEIFLPAGESVEIRALPLLDMRTGEIADVLPAVCRGGDVYYLSRRHGNLTCYLHEEAPGTGVQVRFLGDGTAVARVWSEREETEDYLAHFLWPANVEFWHLEDVPRNIEELKAFEAAHPFPPEGTCARAVSGGNFRREPTGSSEILGQFVETAAEVLGSKMGAKEPWYHVRVGEIEGWASFPYVQPDHWGGFDEGDDLAAVQPVGKAVRQEALRAAPGGESRGVLAEGTLFHVLLRQDGYYYIAIPREEIAFRQSDDSEYGWVPVEAVKTYASPLRARYGLGEKKLIADP